MGERKGETVWFETDAPDFRHRQSAKEHLKLENMTDFWAEIGRCSPMFTRGGHSTRG